MDKEGDDHGALRNLNIHLELKSKFKTLMMPVLMVLHFKINFFKNTQHAEVKGFCWKGMSTFYVPIIFYSRPKKRYKSMAYYFSWLPKWYYYWRFRHLR